MEASADAITGLQEMANGICTELLAIVSSGSQRVAVPLAIVTWYVVTSPPVRRATKKPAADRGLVGSLQFTGDRLLGQRQVIIVLAGVVQDLARGQGFDVTVEEALVAAAGLEP